MQPGNFIKGPWISVDMPFRQIDGARGWQLGFSRFPKLPLTVRPLPGTSLTAFERLGGDSPRNRPSIATGTGSGKTESYLWPILEHCRQEQGQAGDQGDPDLPNERAGQ